MSDLRCSLGVHKWTYTPAIELDPLSTSLGIFKEDALRCCVRCGKKQYQEIYCLGLKPPEYVKGWYTQEVSDE